LNKNSEDDDDDDDDDDKTNNNMHVKQSLLEYWENTNYLVPLLGCGDWNNDKTIKMNRNINEGEKINT
jgi:predicted subunit of tRNA(5-methylaminomethyl-2-thiouridylate) methyltransferase